MTAGGSGRARPVRDQAAEAPRGRRRRAAGALIAALAMVAAAASVDEPVPPRGTVQGVASVLREMQAPGPAAFRAAAFSAAGRADPVVGGLSSSSVGVLVIDDGRHQCSAAMVASTSRRLLATAAHCVWLAGRWQIDGAFFVPGFASGEEPYGRWPVERAWVPTSWQQADSPIDDVAANSDYAFVALQSRHGRLPEDVLGAQGIAWDTGDQVEVAALGYPAAAPYDGQSLRGCTGSARAAPFRTQRSSVGRTGQVLVLACDMTEGASGGPWLIGPDVRTGRGQIVGVSSGGDDTDLVSPRFGADARRLYHVADHAAATD